uniref:Ionotropic glutamate receptor L-glutamate and glycine-binding domain-containing protein n=1 Tax=Plectus sambesii TaxID=2011161 RepID=A0A914XFU8_9BILA
MSQKPVTPLRPIRIATAAYPPFVNDCGIYTLIRTDECPQPGVDHEILGQLFAYAKIPYELYPHTGDVNWGEVQPDGSYDGLIGDVINGKFDTIGAQYAITEIRTTKVDFSYNIHHETAMYLVSNAPNPDEEWIGQATLIYRVFDWQSTVGFLCIVLLLPTMLIVYSLIIDAARKGRIFDAAIIKDTITSYQEALILLLEGKQKHPSLSTRFIFLILAFAVLLLGNLYQGGLFTIMVPADFDAIAWQGFIFRNGSAWKPIFSRNMIMISDFVAAAYERYRNGSDACDDFSQPPATPLPIMSLLSVFLLPAAGSLIGIIMFCYELAKYRRTKRNVKYILPLTAGEFDIMMFPS